MKPIKKTFIRKIIKKYELPIHIYSKKRIIKNIEIFNNKNYKYYYAVKANNNPTILKIIGKKLNFETVSIGEINELIKLGFKSSKISFSGIGKSKFEISEALKKHISFFNVESYQEFVRINNICKKLNINAKLVLRINLEIVTKTHKSLSTGSKESKFGIRKNELIKILKIRTKFSKIIGIGFHLGSQIKEEKIFKKAIKKIIFIRKKFFKKIYTINIGGGIFVNNNYYSSFSKTRIFLKKLHEILNKYNYKFIIEPGRSVIADTCCTLFKVEYIKNNFIITDLGMNNIIRPVLYKSYHEILNISCNKKNKTFNIVGPICESGDYLYKKKSFTAKQGDFLLMLNTGAYCYSMSSDYNSRKKAKELLLEGEKYFFI
ncbi:diaminopimelate decarboxylase [Candidatus Vidania fulgoroideorum]